MLNYIKKKSIISTISGRIQFGNESQDGHSPKSSRADTINLVNPFFNQDVTPKLEYYSEENEHKNVMRPPLELLHKPRDSLLISIRSRFVEQLSGIGAPSDDHKFGWFTMVYVPTFMNFLGQALFLRMGWVAGEAGMILAIVQVMIGTIILLGTVLSMTAICTNGKVGSGGFYFMISRSLGPETGAMFGILYFLTNTVMVAFSIVGVCQGIANIFMVYDVGIVEHPTGVNDQRLLGLITLVLLTIIPLISLEAEAKAQWFLFLIVMVSLVDFFIGIFLPPTEYQKTHGFTGFNRDTFVGNLWPKWQNADFFVVFSVYMSAIAGDFTGASMSGTLKDPTVGIPLGSVLAVCTTSLLYIAMIVFLGSTVQSSADCQDGNCQFGLLNDFNTMGLASALTQSGINYNVEPLFTAGLLAQTLGSALCSYIAAPQTLQALANDGVLPYLTFFAKGYGKLNEPRRGYIIVFVIALAFIGVANFNILASVISNCYLASWGLLNMSCFHADSIDSPSFRPGFQYFNKWISLGVGLICFVLMFSFDWHSAIPLTVLMIITWYISHHIQANTKSTNNTNWGSTLDGQLYKMSLSMIYKLNLTVDHVKNYRPSILLLAGKPSKRVQLIKMANKITKDISLLILADVNTSKLRHNERIENIENWNNYFDETNIKAIYTQIEANAMCNGADMLMQSIGLGKLKPNILMMGYFENWRIYGDDRLIDYFNTIHIGFERHYSIVIYRNPDNNNNNDNNKLINEKRKAYASKFGKYNTSLGYSSQDSADDDVTTVDSVSIRVEYIKRKKLIDIWWLYDDGGLTVLLPYILLRRKEWKKCEIRVFTVIESEKEDEEVRRQEFLKLLTTLRIPYSDVTVFSNLETPLTSDIEKFKYIVKHWMENDFNEDELHITQQQFNKLNEKTFKYIQIRNLMETHSQNSSLIVMTAPIPQYNECPAPLYMAWFEYLSSQMPPFMFIRGNQENVITFYWE